MGGPATSAAEVLVEVVPRLARAIAEVLMADPEVAISLRQYRILERLLDRPHRTGELAARSGVSQATASAAIAALEVRGLVVRGPDPDDGRATRITITPAGSMLYGRARGLVLARVERVTREVSDEDAQALVGLAPVLVAGLDRSRAELAAERRAD